jgi:hypothetical protein
VNVGRSCQTSVGGLAASLASQQVVCVSPGPLELELTPGASSQLDDHVWHDTDADTGAGEPGSRTPLTLGTWRQATPLPTGRSRVGAVALNGHLYSIGGAAPSASSEVLVADLRADGTVGPWNVTTPLPWPLLDHGAAVHHGRIYVAGGSDGASAHGDVLVATLNADGSVAAWTNTGTFGGGRVGATLVASRRQLYVLGGGAVSQGAPRVATLDDAGMPGPWTTTADFTPSRRGQGAASSGGHLFIAGGTDGMNRLDDVQVATPDSTGAIASWRMGPSLLSGNDSLASVAYGGTVFVLGGYSSTVGFLDDVQLAQVDPDGGLSPWALTTPLPGGRMDPRAVAYGGFVYLLGGYRNLLLSDIPYAPVVGNTSHVSITVGTASRCVWVCCQGLDGTECPTVDQCP